MVVVGALVSVMRFETISRSRSGELRILAGSAPAALARCPSIDYCYTAYEYRNDDIKIKHHRRMSVLSVFGPLFLFAMSLSARQKFTNVQSETKLGTLHESLEAFRKAVNFVPETEKKYTLVLVTEPTKQRILLGQKHRGFGKGMFNSFGGKIEPGETHAESARRELEEETGIAVPLQVMTNAKVGVLHFTFADSPMKMTVHLFRMNVAISTPNNRENSSSKDFPLDPTVIRGCEEITPQWFEDWHNIPLDNMFADDSIWLTHLLESKEDLLLDGYFHFHPGGQEASVDHYFVDIRTKKVGPYTLEQRLFHELHNQRVRSPTIKEFKESYAFVNAVRKLFGKEHDIFDVVLDVAGGHGALGGLFLAVQAARQAVVVDPANVGGGSVQMAWEKYMEGRDLRYRYEGLRTGLPAELLRARNVGIRSDRILVVACHACQHLSDETLQIACEFGVHAAVMPCCQRDLSPGCAWKAVSKRLSIPTELVMDIVLAGKAMSWSVGQEHQTSYDVRMKLLEGSSTPQNRIILCRADENLNRRRIRAKAVAQDQLDKAYQRAHILVSNKTKLSESSPVGYLPLLGSFCLGVALTALTMRI